MSICRTECGTRRSGLQRDIIGSGEARSFEGVSPRERGLRRDLGWLCASSQQGCQTWWLIKLGREQDANWRICVYSLELKDDSEDAKACYRRKSLVRTLGAAW